MVECDGIKGNSEWQSVDGEVLTTGEPTRNEDRGVAGCTEGEGAVKTYALRVVFGRAVGGGPK